MGRGQPTVASGPHPAGDRRRGVRAPRRRRRAATAGPRRSRPGRVRRPGPHRPGPPARDRGARVAAVPARCARHRPGRRTARRHVRGGPGPTRRRDVAGGAGPDGRTGRSRVHGPRPQCDGPAVPRHVPPVRGGGDRGPPRPPPPGARRTGGTGPTQSAYRGLHGWPRSPVLHRALVPGRAVGLPPRGGRRPRRPQRSSLVAGARGPRTGGRGPAPSGGRVARSARPAVGGRQRCPGDLVGSASWRRVARERLRRRPRGGACPVAVPRRCRPRGAR